MSRRRGRADRAERPSCIQSEGSRVARSKESIDLDGFRAVLASEGFDITHPLNTSWYNSYIEKEGLPLKPLPNGAVAILIGNSRAMWPKFLAWLGRQVEAKGVSPEFIRFKIPDPLDTFTATAIARAASSALTEGHELYWPWETGDRLVSMQRVAVCSGLCYHDSETQLAIHPEFGAWLAFRAVLVLDAPPAACSLGLEAPSRVGCLMTDAEKAAARAAMAAALRASDEANLCTQLHGEKGMERDVRLAWAALRDCVEVGKTHRYSDAQLTYHYTKEWTVLLAALRESQGASSANNRRSEGMSEGLSGRLSIALALGLLLPLVLALVHSLIAGR